MPLYDPFEIYIKALSNSTSLSQERELRELSIFIQSLPHTPAGSYTLSLQLEQHERHKAHISL